MKYASAFEELRAYLNNLAYMYSMGGVFFNTHYQMVKFIKDYVEHLEEKYE